MKKYSLMILNGLLFIGSTVYSAARQDTEKAIDISIADYNQALETVATRHGVAPDRVGIKITNLPPSLRPGARGGRSTMVTISISPERPSSPPYLTE